MLTLLPLTNRISTVPVVKGGQMVPRCNAKFTQDHIIYEIALPGFGREDVEVSVNPGGELHISSNTSREYTGYVSCPVKVVPFSLIFTIPLQSEVESASMVNGLLTVTIRTQSAKRVAVT